MSADRTHVPVMANEIRSWLHLGDRPGLIVDSTLGEGGHSALLLSDNPQARIIGVDADPVMLDRAREFLGDASHRVSFVHRWFDEFWTEYDGPAPDRILFDLGVSSYHFSASGRGFSFASDEPLDMRLSGTGKSARELLLRMDEQELADVLFHLGGERYSRRIAKAICRVRDEQHLRTAGELAEVIRRAVPSSYRSGRLHPATRSFQALRIVVNGELDRIRDALVNALRAMSADGGRLAVISFHSLEDKIAKWIFRSAAGKHIPEGSAGEDSKVFPNAPKIYEGGEYPDNVVFRILTRKPVSPTREEAQRNPPSRSAKLRVIEKVMKENGK